MSEYEQVRSVRADISYLAPGSHINRRFVAPGVAGLRHLFAPESRRSPVGDPPISTRWDYGEFVVFFEYDKVIHSVTKR